MVAIGVDALSLFKQPVRNLMRDNIDGRPRKSGVGTAIAENCIPTVPRRKVVFLSPMNAGQHPVVMTINTIAPICVVEIVPVLHRGKLSVDCRGLLVCRSAVTNPVGVMLIW